VLLILSLRRQRLQKALHFVRQIHVNHNQMASHAPRAVTRCELRMAPSRTQFQKLILKGQQ
jgi:hypothetical protein